MEKGKQRTILVVLGLILPLLMLSPGASVAGSLDPPGPPSPTIKTLDQVEPRIPVQSLPGSSTAIYVISVPGSYYLTGNVLGETGKDGIQINADDVVLDLNGFAVISDRFDPAYQGVTGIQVQPYGRNVTVYNGTVYGWNQIGVHLPTYNALVYDVLTYNNAWEGISMWIGVIMDCVSHSNGVGIRLDGPGLIKDCTAKQNGDGIVAVGKVEITDCVCDANGNGIKVEFSGKVENCKLVGNTTGIYLGAQTMVSGCHLLNNYLGIFVYNDGSGNHLNNNHFTGGVYGIRIDSPGSRNFVVRNTVRGATTAAYDIPPNNTWGPIIDVTGAGDFSTVPGANHPLANFIF